MTAAVAHPARYSAAILAVLADHIGAVEWVLDPFAGTGRIHALRSLLIGHTVGVELEEEWAALHPDTIHGDALDLAQLFDPGTVPAIATSPAYGNRMADTSVDHTERHTYRAALGRPLSPTNGGGMQWGDTYRSLHERVWQACAIVLRPGGTLTLNCKDHIRAGAVVPVTAWHVAVLEALGLVVERHDEVTTAGLPHGQHATHRTGVEHVVTLRKARTTGEPIAYPTTNQEDYRHAQT